MKKYLFLIIGLLLFVFVGYSSTHVKGISTLEIVEPMGNVGTVVVYESGGGTHVHFSPKKLDCNELKKRDDRVIDCFHYDRNRITQAQQDVKKNYPNATFVSEEQGNKELGL